MMKSLLISLTLLVLIASASIPGYAYAGVIAGNATAITSNSSSTTQIGLAPGTEITVAGGSVTLLGIGSGSGVYLILKSSGKLPGRTVYPVLDYFVYGTPGAPTGGKYYLVDGQYIRPHTLGKGKFVPSSFPSRYVIPAVVIALITTTGITYAWWSVS